MWLKKIRDQRAKRQWRRTKRRQTKRERRGRGEPKKASAGDENGQELNQAYEHIHWDPGCRTDDQVVSVVKVNRGDSDTVLHGLSKGYKQRVKLNTGNNLLIDIRKTSGWWFPVLGFCINSNSNCD